MMLLVSARSVATNSALSEFAMKLTLKLQFRHFSINAKEKGRKMSGR
jgi:hypothetical protein